MYSGMKWIGTTKHFFWHFVLDMTSHFQIRSGATVSVSVCVWFCMCVCVCVCVQKLTNVLEILVKTTQHVWTLLTDSNASVHPRSSDAPAKVCVNHSLVLSLSPSLSLCLSVCLFAFVADIVIRPVATSL